MHFKANIHQVFMTCRDTLTCIHEPFGDAWYYGPERHSKRFEDEQARLASGLSKSTYKSVLDGIEKQQEEVRSPLVLSGSFSTFRCLSAFCNGQALLDRLFARDKHCLTGYSQWPSPA